MVCVWIEARKSLPPAGRARPHELPLLGLDFAQDRQGRRAPGPPGRLPPGHLQRHVAVLGAQTGRPSHLCGPARLLAGGKFGQGGREGIDEGRGPRAQNKDNVRRSGLEVREPGNKDIEVYPAVDFYGSSYLANFWLRGVTV